MAIYYQYNVSCQMEDTVFKSERSEEMISLQEKIKATSSKNKLVSLICIRFFFLVLLAVDVLWGIYCVCRMILCLLFAGFFFYKKSLWEPLLSKSWLSVKRALVCGLSLVVSLFSTGFGIMIACTYFVMYDKDGIEEVVPASLQEYFKDFFQGA